MFKREDIKGYGELQNNIYYIINDLTTWLSLLSKGEAVYIAEPLSYFRQHKGQNQKDLVVISKGFSEWTNVIEDARKMGYLRSIKNYKAALQSCIKAMMYAIRVHHEERRSADLLEINAEQYISNTVNKLLSYPDGYKCNMCGHTSDEFIQWPDVFDFDKYEFEMYNKYTATCPICGTFDRERAYKYFIEHEVNIDKNNRLLHIAPERNLKQWLKPQVGTYIAGDLFPADSETHRVDITDIAFDDEYFDIILCSHVLEHVPDDITAMKEFYRVLKPGGWGILQVPLVLDLSETFEDFTVVTPEERLKVFGQDDHVRVYAKVDYIKRLASVGFKVETFNIAKKYGINEAIRHGLSQDDNLYIVYK
jgi:SAM-dependent methyltransferase